MTLLGHKTVEIDRKLYEYSGELDADGKACGKGLATMTGSDCGVVFEGTWLNDRLHGIGKHMK